jgi:hypothetical protein
MFLFWLFFSRGGLVLIKGEEERRRKRRKGEKD